MNYWYSVEITDRRGYIQLDPTPRTMRWVLLLRPKREVRVQLQVKNISGCVCRYREEVEYEPTGGGHDNIASYMINDATKSHIHSTA